eukprot:3320380-Alexandrium_andersonii.AAC.1
MCIRDRWMTSEGEEAGREASDRSTPILVVRDRNTGNVASHLIPRKGERWFGTKMLRAEIAYLGHRNVVLKSDQEPSIMALKEAVVRECGNSVKVTMEESPVGEGESAGMAERA